MNAKDLKFLQLFEGFVKTDFLADKNLLTKSVKSFLDLDYLLAINMWDYLASAREIEMSKDTNVANLIGDTIFKAFYDRASTKCVKAITDTPSISRAVYQYSSTAGLGDSFTILTELLVAGKIDYSEDILKNLVKNDKISFGETMKRVLEKVFIELLKKNPAKIEMSKKLSTLVLTYVKKIKSDERAMLEQRIREIQ